MSHNTSAPPADYKINDCPYSYRELLAMPPARLRALAEDPATRTRVRTLLAYALARINSDRDYAAEHGA